jgi:hypothetical protein
MLAINAVSLPAQTSYRGGIGTLEINVLVASPVRASPQSALIAVMVGLPQSIV